jgi:hypothetical protein
MGSEEMVCMLYMHVGYGLPFVQVEFEKESP